MVFIAHIVVDHQCSADEGAPLHVLLKTSTAITLNIVVSQIAYVTLRSLYRGYATIGKLTGGCQLQREAPANIHIN